MLWVAGPGLRNRDTRRRLLRRTMNRGIRYLLRRTMNRGIGAASSAAPRTGASSAASGRKSRIMTPCKRPPAVPGAFLYFRKKFQYLV